jgi:deoxycytidylate deaminase
VNLDRLIQIAIFEAKKSNYKQKMSCVLFDKKKIISVEHNRINSHKRNLHSRFQRWGGSIHCEVASILAAKTDLKGVSALVVRINNNDELRYSKPCDRCMEYFRFVQLKDVYFVNREFKIERIKI